MKEIKQLIGNIKSEAAGLFSVLWTTEQLKDQQYKLYEFHQQINYSAFGVIRRLYRYETFGWKRFVPDVAALERDKQEREALDEQERLAEWLREYPGGFGRHDWSALVPKDKVDAAVEACGFQGLRRFRVLDVGFDGRPLNQWVSDARYAHATIDEFLKVAFSRRGRKYDMVIMFNVLAHIIDESLRRLIGQAALGLLSDNGMVMTADLKADAELKLSPYLLYTSLDLGVRQLADMFPNCCVEYEETAGCGFGVIRKTGRPPAEGLR